MENYGKSILTFTYIFKGTVRDSNRAMLVGACQAEGASVVDLGICGEDDGGARR